MSFCVAFGCSNMTSRKSEKQKEKRKASFHFYKEAHKIIEEENQSAKSGPKNQQFEDNKMELEANIGGQAGTESTGTEDTKSNIKGVANQNTNESRPKFHCDVCGRWFIHQGRYLEHRRRHKGVYFVCTECNLQFQNKVSLNKHQLKTGHSGTHVTEGLEDAERVENTSSQISVECHNCKKTLKNAHNLKVHLKTIHGHKPYTCEKCGKSFAFKCRLTEHMKYHNDGKSGYPCEFCGRTFKIKTSLYYHKDVTHVVGRTFECKICGEHFKHKKLLVKHQAVHSTNRTYICQYCPLQFKTKENVVRHERLHKNEINFLCHICGRLFTRHFNLVTHFRTHRSHERLRAREKNFLCHICGKLFSLKCTMRVHFKLH